MGRRSRSNDSEERRHPPVARDDDTSDWDTQRLSDGPVPVGVKLGSCRTVVVYPTGEGQQVVRRLTCITTYRDALTGEHRELHGEEAASEYPAESEFMLRGGLPVDDQSTAHTRRFFDSLMDAHDIPSNSIVVYAIPSIAAGDGLDNLATVIKESSSGEALVRSYPESLCGSVATFDSCSELLGKEFISVNLGATTLGVCAYKDAEQLLTRSYGGVTGDGVDRRISNHIVAETQGRVNVDSTTAREYKEEYADLEQCEPFTEVIQQPGGGTHQFSIHESVIDAVDEYVDDLVSTVANRFLADLKKSHPAVHERILETPIVTAGGMACIPGLTEVFAERLGETIKQEITATRADRPDVAAAKGAQKIASCFAKQ